MADSERSAVTSKGFEPTGPAVPDYTEGDDGLLTEEERKALAEDDGEGEGDETPAQDSEAAAQEGEDGEESTDGEDGAEGEAEAAKADDTAQKKEPEPEPEKTAEPKDYTLPDPDAYAQTIEAKEAELEKLQTDYEDGELTEAERDEKAKAIRSDLREANRQLAKAEIRREDWERDWKAAVQSFAAKNPDLIENHYQALDGYVRAVNSDTRDWVQRMSHEQRLRHAYAQYATDAKAQGIEVPPLDGAESQPEPKAQKTEAERKREQLTSDEAKKAAGTAPDAPQTLGNVPAAAINEAGGRFAELDKLSDKDPVAYERALDRLSEHDRNLYLQQ